MKPDLQNTSNNINSVNDIVAALQLVLEQKNSEKSEKAAMLQDLLYDEYAEKKAAKDEDRKNQLEIKKQNGFAMDKRAKEKEAAQSFCPHIKNNRESHIVGQRDHSNNFHWICQGCQKDWLNQELPAHLYPDMNRVGGPSLS